MLRISEASNVYLLPDCLLNEKSLSEPSELNFLWLLRKRMLFLQVFNSLFSSGPQTTKSHTCLMEGLPIKLLEGQTIQYFKNHNKEYYLIYTNKKKSAAPNIVIIKKNYFSSVWYESI